MKLLDRKKTNDYGQELSVTQRALLLKNSAYGLNEKNYENLLHG